jgi:hypothetical protein
VALPVASSANPMEGAQPSILPACPCASTSISSTRWPPNASPAARLTAVVVFLSAFRKRYGDFPH